MSGEVTVCSNRSTITVVCEGGQVEVDARSCHWNRDGSLNYTGGVFGVHQNMRRSGALSGYQGPALTNILAGENTPSLTMEPSWSVSTVVLELLAGLLTVLIELSASHLT